MVPSSDVGPMHMPLTGVPPRGHPSQRLTVCTPPAGWLGCSESSCSSAPCGQAQGIYYWISLAGEAVPSVHFTDEGSGSPESRIGWGLEPGFPAGTLVPQTAVVEGGSVHHTSVF